MTVEDSVLKKANKKDKEKKAAEQDTNRELLDRTMTVTIGEYDEDNKTEDISLEGGVASFKDTSTADKNPASNRGGVNSSIAVTKTAYTSSRSKLNTQAKMRRGSLGP